MASFNRITPELTLEEIENYFSFGNSFVTQKQLPSGIYKGQCFNPNPGQSDFCETTTLRRKQSEEEEIVDDIDDTATVDPFGSMISGDMQNLEIESVSSLVETPTCSNYLSKMELLEVYDHYDFSHKYNDSLPIIKHQTEILETVGANRVTIIQGSTGSGKTTQVPQFILDDHARRKKHCNIVITQPRKIAAISIANRVSHERKWQTGRVVGYQVGLEKKTSQDTRITYMTTGVLLRQLIKAKHLNDYTHIILDEVHERDVDTDFAMLLVRKLLWMNSNLVKVILMSATFDTSVFAEYYGSPVGGRLQAAPAVTVGGRLYDVTEHYIEDLSALGSLPSFQQLHAEIHEETYAIASRLVIHFDKIEMEERIQNAISSSASITDSRGSVLVFLPGIFQIREMEEILNYARVDKKLQIIPLHSSITLEEQSDVFKKAKPGYRKVILSTNIAESSITVPDIKYVIDFCLTKAMVCDLDTNYQSLRLQWASKASARQRAGRAGRLSNGKVYRLIARSFWETKLDDYAVPEMQRCSLESAILQVKLLDLGDPRSVLSLALSPPNMHNIERTILLLKEIGALSSVSNKRLDGDLTFVGRVLATLPIDMRLGKLLMLGFVFGCFSNCLIIAAALSKPCFFATPYNKGLKSYKKKLHWAQGTFSDCIAMLNAYKCWEKCCQTQKFRRTSDEKEWGRENFVQIRRIHEVRHQVEELRCRMRSFNIRSDDAEHWSLQDPQENELILKITMAGAFYPNYFEQSLTDENTAVKDMSLLDPANTVRFVGLPCGKAPLFKNALVQVTKECGQQKAVYYDGSKAYVEFKKTTEIDTGSINPAVYIACKMRDTRKKIELCQSHAESKNTDKANRNTTPFRYDPLIEENYSNEVPKPGGMIWFPFHVTHVISVTQMWGNKLLSKNIDFLHRIADVIQNEVSTKLDEECISEGKLVLAQYDDGEQISYYRALITKLVPVLTVWFVDYGNTSVGLEKRNLRKCPSSIENIPFQAIEIRLRGIQKIENAPSEESKDFLHELFYSSGNVVRVKVYSVVSDVTCADLFTRDDQYVNEILTQANYCEPVEESKISQLSHSSWELAEREHITDEKFFSEKFSEQWVKVDDTLRGPPIPLKNGRIVSVCSPRTTFESSYTSIVQIGRLRNVSVDHNSINSVCINQTPASSVKAMIVASEVGINQSGSTMLARNTTLLPNIKGLQSLLCVMFAPVVEFRCNRSKTSYTGAICGLGAVLIRKKWVSVLPDHDIEVQFDAEFEMQDIIDINSIRMMINLGVGSEETIGGWNLGYIHKCQLAARSKLLAILKKQRAAVEPKICQRPFQWNLVSEKDLLPHQVSDETADKKDFFRLHQGLVILT